jgi:hypothetical protein
MAYRRLGRFNKKRPTAVKNPYMIFSCHDPDLECPIYNPPSVSEFYGRPGEMFIQIMAIDPGIKNCGIRIERRWSSGHVETVMLARINFLISDDAPSDTIYYTNSIATFKRYIPIMELCQYILIESQLPINYDMVRMSSHIISYLMSQLANKGCRPLIYEVDTYFKSRILNAPPKMTKPELKKWCRNYALKLMEDRKDDETYKLVKNIGKFDDVSDTICYCEGFYKALTEGLHPIRMPGIKV